MRIYRSTDNVKRTIQSGQSQTEAIDYRNFSSGQIIIPAAWDAADIGFLVAGSLSTTFQQLKSSTGGTLVQIDTIVAGETFKLPDELFGSHYFKIWSQSAGTGVNQTADRELFILLKG